jgi:hypothetical protein
MKRIFVEFIILICSIILPGSVFAVSGFSEKMLLDELNSNDDICFPRVCTGNNNAVYVIWSDQDKSGTTSIFFVVSLDGGVSFEEKQEIEVVTDEDVIVSSPNIGVDSKGTIYIVYSRYDSNNSQFTLLLRKSENGGKSFEKQTIFERQSGASTILGSHYGSDIKFTDKGIYYVWTSYSDIFCVCINDDGNDFEVIEVEDQQSEADESIVARYKIWPSLAVDSNDNTYVVWYEAHILKDKITDPKLFDLYFAKLYKDHQSFTEYKMIAKCDSFQGFVVAPSIISTSSNQVFVFWNKAASSSHDAALTQPINKIMSNDGGVTFSEPSKITFGEDATVQNHGVRIDQNDGIHFIYFLSNNGTLYYNKSSNLCTSFNESVKIGLMAFWADMCLSKNDEIVYIVWPEKQQNGKMCINFSRSTNKVIGEGTPKSKTGGGGCFIQNVLY